MKAISKKQKILLALLAALVLLAVVGMVIYNQMFVSVCGRHYPVDQEKLDLRSCQNIQELKLLKFDNLREVDLRGSYLTVSQYEWLKENLPQCSILWEIPFEGKDYAPETEEITVENLNEDSVAALRVFHHLKLIRISSFQDYENIRSLQEDHPDCKLVYDAELAGETWSSNTRDLTVADADVEELRQHLPYLPLARSVTLVGEIPTMEEIRSLQKEFPEISFSWKVSLWNQVMDSGIKIIMPNRFQDPQELVDKIEYFPELKTISLLNTELTTDEKQSIAKALPDREVIWDIQIGNQKFVYDAEEIEISGQTFTDTKILADAIPYFKDLKKMVVLDSGLESEVLDALNKQFPDTRVVWNLDIGYVEMRTDDLYYAPNKYPGSAVTDEALKDLKYCTDLLCVDVGHGWVTHCEWAAYMPHLRYLIIADTSISSLEPLRNLRELVFLECFLSPVADASPLLEVTSLEDLNLCRTPCKLEPVPQMKWLKRLWWTGAPAYEWDLEEMLPNTEVECGTTSSTGKGWRTGRHYYDMRDLIGMWYMTY